MKKQRSKGSQCCETCPFLKGNFGKETPNQDTKDLEWYSKENAERLWHDGLKHGEAMVCHSSDHESIDYGGKNKVAEGKRRLCSGSLLVQFRHLKLYEKMTNKYLGDPNKGYREYKRAVGVKIAMTKGGILEFGMCVILGRTGLIGGFPLPKNIDDEEAVALPWKDNVGNVQVAECKL